MKAMPQSGVRETRPSVMAMMPSPATSRGRGTWPNTPRQSNAVAVLARITPRPFESPQGQSNRKS